MVRPLCKQKISLPTSSREQQLTLLRIRKRTPLQSGLVKGDLWYLADPIIG
jgi:hypothetical protein